MNLRCQEDQRLVQIGLVNYEAVVVARVTSVCKLLKLAKVTSLIVKMGKLSFCP